MPALEPLWVTVNLHHVYQGKPLGVPMKWGSWEHITCKHGEEKGAGLCMKSSGW